MWSKKIGVSLAAIALCTTVSNANAEDYVVGASVALSGYLATLDRGWTDGVRIGVEQINKQGGVLGRKFKLVIGDNRSEPQEAVSAYNKMLLSDRAKVFISGCLSAGNFAAAPIVIRRKIPMIVCSVIPRNKGQAHWVYSTLPLPTYEIVPRLTYLKNKTSVKKIGVLYGQSPYANLLSRLTKKIAPKFGIEVVGAEQYTQTDADLSTQIKKLTSAGAQAILKMGVGPSTITAAKNIKALGLSIPLLVGVGDLKVLKPTALEFGNGFFFVASPPQVYSTLAEGNATKKVIAQFLVPWQAKYGDRDPTWAGRGYDAVLFLAEAIRTAKSFDGPKVRDAMEKISNFQGTSGAYNFDKNHYGVTNNPLVLTRYMNGKLDVLK